MVLCVASGLFRVFDLCDTQLPRVFVSFYH